LKAGESLKYRRNKVKREHGIIQNALLWLENLGRLSEVADIIPGVINVSHSPGRGIVFKYETQTGCKLLLKSNGSIQEVFVVTKDPTRVQEWVKQEFPPETSSVGSQSTSKTTLPAVPRKPLPCVPKKSKRGLEHKTCHRGLHPSKKRSSQKGPKHILIEKEAPNVADRLDRVTLKALSHLKKSLEYAKIQDAKTKRENFQER